MKDIYILGSGGFAKEVFALINCIGGYTIKGFINKEKTKDLVFNNDIIPVIGEDDFLNLNREDVCLAIGVGNPKLSQEFSMKFKKYDFPNLLHPSVQGDFENIEMGKGNIFTSNVTLTTCIKIGSFNVFNLLITIGHDVVIGNYNIINPSVNILGGVIIGNTNLIGVNSTILQYKKIGNNSTIGACSMVINNVPDNVTVVGIPARKFFDK